MMRRCGAAVRLALALLIFLPGCALLRPTPPAAPGEAAWTTRRAELSALDHWVMQARVASGLFSGSGNLRWQQAGEKFDIRVSGPLGASGFQARGHLGAVEIRTAKESIVTADPEGFLDQSVGWSMPLGRLRYWAVGVPYPPTPAALRYDSAGRLQSLEQDGWKLEYSEYGFFQHYELPRRFTLDNGDKRFKVIVDDWSGLG